MMVENSGTSKAIVDILKELSDEVFQVGNNKKSETINKICTSKSQKETSRKIYFTLR